MRRSAIYLLVMVSVIAVALFFMPLRLAVSMAGLPESQFSARDVSGSIWNGHIEKAQLGPFALGDLGASLQFLPLFAGNVRLDLESSAGSVDTGLTATIGKEGKNLLVENASTTLNVGGQLAPLPASNIDLDNVSVSFADGQCQTASGQVRLSLDSNIPGLDLKQGLLGNAECQDGALVLPLTSGSGMEILTLKLEGDGLYSARLLLSGNQRGWTLLLPALGFQKVPSGYAIKTVGQLGKKK